MAKALAVGEGPELAAAAIPEPLERVQAGAVPAAECQLRAGVVCEGGFTGRTGFCLLHFEMFWVLWRRGKKKAVAYHKNWQDMTHLK